MLSRAASPGFWTATNCRWLLRSVFVLMLLSLPALVWYTGDREISIRHGDFPAFYAAAELSANHDTALIYDLESNRALQSRDFNSKGVVPFLYPPFFALLLSPLSHFNPDAAHLIFIGLMLITLLSAIHLAAQSVPLMRGRLFDSMAALLLLAPILSGVFSAQTTALSLLCFAGLLHYSNHDDKRHHYLAGIFLGAWFFKPHFALIALLCVLLMRRYETVLTALGVALLYYFTASFYFGFDWPVIWASSMFQTSQAELGYNIFNQISLNGALSALSGWFELPQNLAQQLPYLICIPLFIYCLTPFWRFGKSKQSVSCPDLIFLIAPIVVVFSPHTLHYDLGLVVFSVTRYLKLESDRSITLLLLLYLALFYLTTTRGALPVTPLALFALGSLIFVWHRLELSKQS